MTSRQQRRAKPQAPKNAKRDTTQDNKPVQISVGYNQQAGTIQTRYTFPVDNINQSPEEALRQVVALLEACKQLKPEILKGYQWPLPH